MESSPEVRQARRDDADGIARVQNRSWRAAYGHVFGAERLARLSDEQRASAWRARLADPAERTRVLVAEEHGEVVGFAMVGRSRDPDARASLGELYALYADPSRWSRGVGRELMRAAVSALRELGFDEATLWVLDDNPRARRFYEAGGWLLEDGTAKRDAFLDTPVTEVRYRLPLERYASPR